MTEELVIIGNNFSGLGSAIACARNGCKVKIIAPKKQSILLGGLQVAPNARAALSVLGIDSLIHQKATQLAAVEIKSFDTAVNLATIPLPSEAPTYIGIAREDLYHILMDSCLTNSLIEFTDASLLAISQTEEQTNLALDNGEVVSASIVIGADGWHGKTRQFVSSGVTQQNTGYSIYRSVYPAAKLPASFSSPNTQLWLGKFCHLVTYPISNGRDVNLVFTFSDKKFPDSSIHTILSNHPILGALLNQEYSWHLSPIKKFETLFNWRRGGITLIGDAAHPMAPHLAQGAAQSFIDIACMENNLSKGQSLADAIRNMVTVRMPKAQIIARKSQISGQIFRLNGPIATARNQIIGVAGEIIINEFLQDLWLTA